MVIYNFENTETLRLLEISKNRENLIRQKTIFWNITNKRIINLIKQCKSPHHNGKFKISKYNICKLLHILWL